MCSVTGCVLTMRALTREEVRASVFLCGKHWSAWGRRGYFDPWISSVGSTNTDAHCWCGRACCEIAHVEIGSYGIHLCKQHLDEMQATLGGVPWHHPLEAQ